MSGPAVVIGYICLIPSVIGIAISAFMFVTLLVQTSSGARASARAAAIAEMRGHRVEQQIIDQVVTDPTFNPYKADGDDLPARQLKWVIDAQNKLVLANERSASRASLALARGEVIGEMQENDVPAPIIREVMTNPTFDPEPYMDELGMARLSWVQDAQAKLRTAAYRSQGVEGDVQVGRALGQSFFIVTGVTSFVGGLLGWLLVMKKRVLQCSFCQAVVNAS